MFTKSFLPLITTAAAFLAVSAHAQTAKASIRDWDLPKANTFPHDPLAAPRRLAPVHGLQRHSGINKIALVETK